MILLLLAATLFATPEQPLSETRQGVAATNLAGIVTATNGETLLAVWQDTRGAQAARFDATGTRLEPISIGLPLTSAPLAVFWNDEHWVVLAAESFARLDANGNVVDRTERPLDLGLSKFAFNRLRAAWTGSAALVVTQKVIDSDRDLLVWTLDRDMVVLRQLNLTPGGGWWADPWGPVSNGSSTVLFYSTVNLDPPALRAAAFDRFGQLERDRVMERSYVQEAAVATDGERFAILHREPFSEPIWHGFTVDRDLRRRGFPSLRISATYAYGMKLVFDGTVWTAYVTVVEGNKATVKAIRIARDGTVLDETPVPVLSYDANGIMTAAAMGGTTFLFYADGAPPDEYYAFVKMRAAPSPEAMAAADPVDLSIGPFVQEAPVVAKSETQSLAAWREEMTPDGAATILATRIDTAGQIRDPQAIALGNSLCTVGPTATASDGRDFLVAWQEPDAISGAIVGADGTTRPWRLSTSGLEYPWPCDALQMAAASNGSTYLVLWTPRDTFRDRRDLWMVRVASDGTVLDDQPISFLSKPDSAVLASDGRDFLVIAGDDVFRIPSQGVAHEIHGIRLGGTALGVWWNGSRYTVVVRDEDESGVRLRFIGADGSSDDGESTPLHPLTDFAPFTAARDCDARGCSYASIVDGTLVRTRLEEKNGQVSISSQSVVTPTYPSGTYAPRELRLTGDLLLYSRRVLEQGNASRVFMIRMTTMRGRAVRH